MICKKTNSYFEKTGENKQPINLCYYHYRSSEYRINNFDAELIRILLRDNYSCNGIKNYLLAKLRELENV